MENGQPKLRFPEFKDEWKKEILNNIVDVRDGTHDSPKYISESKYFLLTSKNLNKDGRLDFNDIKYLNKTDFDKINLRSKVEYNDILFGMIGTIGNPVLIKENEINFAIKNMALLKKSENILPDFLLQQFKSPIIDKQFNKLNTGNTQKFISLSTIRNLLIFNPTKPEQTKIADFLGRVDKQLELLTTKKEKLQLYKKGVMQKLFSQEIRFTKEDGTNYPDWEEKTLGELFKIQAGKDYKHLNSGNIPVYGTGGIMLYVDDYLFDGISVCIGRKGTIDKPMLLNGKFWTVDTLFYTKDFKGCIPEYIYQLFLNIKWRSYNEASGVPSLSTKIIKNIEVSVPSLEEQTKIADFLIAIDNQIDAIDNQIKKTENYKKGLLQQMFV